MKIFNKSNQEFKVAVNGTVYLVKEGENEFKDSVATMILVKARQWELEVTNDIPKEVKEEVKKEVKVEKPKKSIFNKLKK